MNKKKIITSILAGVMAVTTIAAPAFAAVDDQAVIDLSRTGTLNIHKLIENDGQNDQAYGLATGEQRIPVNNIGFDYVKIADITNVRGIVISEDGSIDWDADNGKVSVGAYYQAGDLLDSLTDTTKLVPEATYIKTSVVGDANTEPTVQYEYADQKAANELQEEQAAVDSAKADMETARIAYLAALDTYVAAYQTSTNGRSSAEALRAIAFNASIAAEAARSAADAASTAWEDADAANTAAQDALTQAQADLDAATDAYNDALASYSGNDDSTLALLNQAKEALLEAQNQAKEAANQLKVKQDELAKANADKTNAQDALTAADNILREATEANDRSDLGIQDTIDGTLNALTYATAAQENAQSYFDAMDTAQQNAADAEEAANTALTNLQTALQEAQDALAQATSNNSDAYSAFADAKAAMDSAQAAYDNANQVAQDAADALQTAQTNLDAAQEASQTAQQKAEEATAAYEAANTDAETAEGTTSEKQQALADAETEYNAKFQAYKDAIEALDTAAANLGIQKFYTAEQLQNFIKQLLATMSEDDINNWVKDNTDYNGAAAGQHTDDNGIVSFSGLPLGLYLVAETDDSYHDGLAGAYNDAIGETGHINNDQQNYYENGGTTDGKYYIYPIDAHDNDGNGELPYANNTHEYSYGEAYRESVNPEYPVVESKAAPFFVSLPTTNAVDTTANGSGEENSVAAGDNYGAAGTVWQYTLDVYPKNQTTAIYKRIIDPDEGRGTETLRTSEDYQIGDVIETVIWAEAPTLQPNYLDVDNVAAGNKHLGYIISDVMTESESFGRVTQVSIIPAAQLKGANNVSRTSYIYYDPDGNRVDAEEALVNPADPDNSEMNSIIKYYDAEGHEITKDVYDAASELNIGDGKPYFKEYFYKKYRTIGNLYTGNTATNASQFDIVYNAEEDEGIVLDPADYQVIETDNTNVYMNNNKGETECVINSGTHGFAVALTASGLQKLNARTSDSVVVVYFESILNGNAKIGQAYQNMNYANLFWANTNTPIKHISSNEVYEYTYELVLKKEDVEDATNVKFVISRDDTNDFSQAEEKDQTDKDSYNDRKDPATGTFEYGQDDSIKFVKEAEGVYHVWGYMSDENSHLRDDLETFETTEINGVTYATVTPATDGTLRIKGLDSDSYIFKEVQTEAGKNLLKEPFKVILKAADVDREEPLTNTRDGRLSEATVETGNSGPLGITIGYIGTDASDSMDGRANMGIASMNVRNYDIVDLRTGGAGRTLIYILGAVALAAMATGFVVVNRKKKGKSNQ